MINQPEALEDHLNSNISMYESYYRKPSWWFKLRYGTQIKRKTIIHLVTKGGKSFDNQRLLEIGFGSGEVLFSFHSNCEIHGIELSESAVQIVSRRAKKLNYPSVNLAFSNVSSLNFPDSYFDIVIASHVIEHLSDDKQSLKEIHRVLKPDGLLIILIPIFEKFSDPNHMNRYSPDSFLSLAVECSFTPIYMIKNDYLFRLIERFYYQGYKEKLGIFGSVISAIFNIPTSICPFPVYQWIDNVFLALKVQPRQLGCALKINNIPE